MKCPKCGYVRQETDTAPDYECPKCGVIYSKVGAVPEGDEEKLKAIKRKANLSSNKPQRQQQINDKREVSTSTAVVLAVAVICLIGGYFVGREHVKYEVRQKLAEVFNAKSYGLLSEKTIIIDMQGDKGTEYSGQVQVVSADGSSQGETVRGVVPEVYTRKGAIVSATFQKTSGDDSKLLVTITDEERLTAPVKIASTDSPYGVVSVALGE